MLLSKCYRPSEKVCNGQGPEECRTVYESSCTTKYVEKQPGKFVADTGCEKLPVEIFGAGCTYEEGAEECHDKITASVVDVPEEICDLNPQETCRFVTKLVPKLVYLVRFPVFCFCFVRLSSILKYIEVVLLWNKFRSSLIYKKLGRFHFQKD